MSGFSDTLVIDLGKDGGPVYTGRDKGRGVRDRYKLNSIDRKYDVKVKVIVPEIAFSLNSSYFLGLFGQSIRSCGSRTAFLDKFEFSCPDHIRDDIDSGIERALYERKPLID